MNTITCNFPTQTHFSMPAVQYDTVKKILELEGRSWYDEVYDVHLDLKRISVWKDGDDFLVKEASAPLYEDCVIAVHPDGTWSVPFSEQIAALWAAVLQFSDLKSRFRAE